MKKTKQTNTYLLYIGIISIVILFLQIFGFGLNFLESVYDIIFRIIFSVIIAFVGESFLYKEKVFFKWWFVLYSILSFLAILYYWVDM